MFADAGGPAAPSCADVNDVMLDLRLSLESVVYDLFGNVQMRWVDAYFPFTDPSLELEVRCGGWGEV